MTATAKPFLARLGLMVGLAGSLAAPSLALGAVDTGAYSVVTVGSEVIGFALAGVQGPTFNRSGTDVNVAISGALSLTKQLTSTLATGTAPFVVASTTVVGNLNVSQLLGATWAAPAAIGTGTPAAGTFTNVTDSALTSGRITRATTAGLLTDAADLTYSSQTLVIGDASSFAQMQLNGAAGQVRYCYARTAGSTRWTWGGNAVAESGSNAGCSFVINALDDSGVAIDSPITILRALGGTMTLLRPISHASTFGDIAGTTTPINSSVTHTITANNAQAMLNRYTVNTSGTFNLTHATGIRGFQGSGNCGLTSPGVQTAAIGVAASVTNSGTGTLSNAYVLYAFAPANSGGGVLTNAYGLYIENVSVGATLNYAIFTNGGTVRLGGLVNVNDTTDATSGTVASINTLGGIGITKALWVGTSSTLTGNVTMTGNQGLVITQAVSNASSRQILLLTASANTLITSGTEVLSAYFNFNRTQQWATTVPATQREFCIDKPTYSCDTAGQTITTAATLAITAAPVAGTNVTITNPLALWVQAGSAKFDGTTDGTSGTSGAITTLGGIGVTKGLWVGTGFFLANGTFTATRSDDGTSTANAFSRTSTIVGAVTDSTLLSMTPAVNGAFTVTRYNYLNFNDVTGTSTITDSCIMRFNAAAGTHRAVDASSTKTTPGGVDAWLKVNINGTKYFVPAYLSKTA